MVKRVLTSIITLTVLMGVLVACGGSDSEVAELRAELEDLKAQLETEETTQEESSEGNSNNATVSERPVGLLPSDRDEPELGYDDFDPYCWVSGLYNDLTYLQFQATITNATSERARYSATIDIYFDGDWVQSESVFFGDIPPGERLTEISTSDAYRGRSWETTILDFDCEIAEFTWR